MTSDWESLQAAIDGEMALPDSPAYEDGLKVFNARFHDVRPQAIVRCATPEDVSEAVAFVRRHRLEHATRSGGHCFAGRSSTQGIVIDVTPMAAVSLSGEVAAVGAGARLGEVYEALEEHDLTIPAGTCPAVGIAGLALGGGLGIVGRKYGVTSDHLVGAQIVLADGRILECDQNRDPDLFWALRGAGAATFGVVTSLAFRPIPAPEVTNFHAAWSLSEAVAVIEAWQRWAPRGVDELMASLKVTVTGEVDQPPSVDLYGALLGAESEAMELLDQLVRRAGSDPSAASAERMSYSETRRFWAQLGAADDAGEVANPRHPFLFSKSEFFGRTLPTEAIAALLEAFAQERSPGEERELDFMPWGGAYNRVPPDATAFVHRDELFLLKHTAVVDSSAHKQTAHRWVTRSWALVHPWGSGRVFQNFPDPDLERRPDAYYGTNLDRLVRIKGHYDPENFFRSHESLGVP
jgi:FAD/FMN-containing dehydrogenase